jgi:hypothetical protein
MSITAHIAWIDVAILAAALTAAIPAMIFYLARHPALPARQRLAVSLAPLCALLLDAFVLATAAHPETLEQTSTGTSDTRLFLLVAILTPSLPFIVYGLARLTLVTFWPSRFASEKTFAQRLARAARRKGASKHTARRTATSPRSRHVRRHAQRAAHQGKQPQGKKP